MKEALYAAELKIIQGFKPTKNEWYVKESGRRRRLVSPVAEGEGSSSKPRKKQKKKAETMLIDESEEEVPEVNIEEEQEAASVAHIEIETDLFTTEADFVDRPVTSEVQKEKEKVIDDVEGDDVDKDTTSSSSGSGFEIVDAKEREKRMREEVEKEKLLRKRRREEKEDAPYEPSPEHISASQSTPKSKRKLELEKRIDEVIAENKKLEDECKRIAEREKSLAGKVQRLEGENKVLELKIEVDQTEIDVLKVRVSELEEEKSRRESENEYYKLKNKELMAAKALHEHKFYMLNRVVESMLETSVEQKYEELKLEDLRAERKAEAERQMKEKGKAVEGSSVMSIVPSMVVDNPVPISSVPGIVEEEIQSSKLIGDEEEEDDEDDDEEEFVYSASSHSSKGNDDDDAAGGTGVRISEASKEKVVEDLLNDTVNEESGEAGGKGESSKNQIVEHHEPLFLCLDVYREMLNDVNPENQIDLEADLESFDINKQKDYKYNYVEDADQYDRVEVEDCSDNEDVSEDTSKLPTLMEFFAAENREELRQKVNEAVNENVFECLRKEAEQESQSNVEKEDHSKWFKDSHERKFKSPLKFFQRDRSISLGDIISWGFLPQVNAYAVRREYGVQYFKRLYDIMSLPWWDVDELSQVRTLEYQVRQNDKAMWGYIKYETLRGYLKWKPHRPRRVERVDPETGVRETIPNVKPPRTMTMIPMSEMEQDFYKGFIDWVYSCLTTEAIITYRAGSELRYIRVYDPMWLVNCSAKDIECLFIHKIRYKAEDKDQAQQFQRVVSLCFQKGINSESKWKSSWWALDEKMKKKAKRERENRRMEEKRGKFLKKQQEEEKVEKRKREKIRVALSRKPKGREENYKAAI
ncbi:serine/threonine-protein kinase GIN4-like [Helianthus annuus]|uniref:serine/threonine-protein kinase GIN4-like n=1 Tax=Helianthus annuus TaxID=4232 RepID=UPI0016532F0B|nr:serine/threonine-protein kinase GIN4-like [Helianthus annuus]